MKQPLHAFMNTEESELSFSAAAEKHSHQLSTVPLLYESKFKSLDGLKK